MTDTDQQANDTFWLDGDHGSTVHLEKTIEVLKTLHADDEIVQIYQWFYAIRAGQLEIEDLQDQLNGKQQTTLDDLIKIHQADWLIKPKSNNAEVLRRLLFAMINDVRLVLMRAAVDFDQSM